MDAAEWFDDFKWGLALAREAHAVKRPLTHVEFHRIQGRMREFLGRDPFRAAEQGGRIAQGARMLMRMCDDTSLPLPSAKPMLPLL